MNGGTIGCPVKYVVRSLARSTIPSPPTESKTARAGGHFHARESRTGTPLTQIRRRTSPTTGGVLSRVASPIRMPSGPRAERSGLGFPPSLTTTTTTVTTIWAIKNTTKQTTVQPSEAHGPQGPFEVTTFGGENSGSFSGLMADSE